ncbi:CRISPR-associated protein Csx18 [Spirulina subsalsa]|uniref:CRISPR-associated protein Csx18 n=1 Tax=Spirulina subsalsa TaxID=54311 RepID=UPI0002FE1C00|nr:CRISPR-associated protein Csx18 [Spirulina subsalsa]
MYISTRAALVRSTVAAAANGAITLALLLIAPLGLAAVITNTVLITLSTLLVCMGGDLVVAWLSGTVPPSPLPRGSSAPLNPHHREDVHDIRRY